MHEGLGISFFLHRSAEEWSCFSVKRFTLNFASSATTVVRVNCVLVALTGGPPRRSRADKRKTRGRAEDGTLRRSGSLFHAGHASTIRETLFTSIRYPDNTCARERTRRWIFLARESGPYLACQFHRFKLFVVAKKLVIVARTSLYDTHASLINGISSIYCAENAKFVSLVIFAPPFASALHNIAGIG